MLLTDKKKKIRNLVTNPRTMEIGQTPLKGQWKLDKTPLKRTMEIADTITLLQDSIHSNRNKWLIIY